VVFCAAATRIAPVGLADFVRVLWRPVLAAVVMIAAVRAVQATGDLMPVLGLIRDSAAGAAVFVAAQLALWAGSGRPPGPEQILLDRARTYLGKAPPAGAVRI
jgi:hypothetical protein